MPKKKLEFPKAPPRLPVDVTKPQETLPVMRAFPASVIGTLLPYPYEIPKEWADGYYAPSKADLEIKEWISFVEAWFHRGLKEGVQFYGKEGISAETAFHHVHCVLRSYEPKHEHKIFGAAYLCSLWFTPESRKLPPT